MKLFIAPGFLVWSGVLISGALFGIFWLVPRYGKTQMLVHIVSEHQPRKRKSVTRS